LEDKAMAMTMISPGYSATAQYLRGVGQQTADHLRQTEVFGSQSTVSALATIYDQCKADNWDGDGALAVLSATAIYAREFVQALPFGIEKPSVGVEPDGHITLEWYRHPRWTASISVAPEGKLYYAGLFGISKVNGTEPFFIGGGIPKPVLELIQRTILHVES
jgi:hypothetical protein